MTPVIKVLFGGAGVLAYLAFGSEVQTVVITNLDSKSKFVQAVQLLYSLAILLSVPLQLFPAVRIMENGLFTRSGKSNPKVKWMKNGLRFAIVMFCAGVSWAGASDLDKFAALVGSFAWYENVHACTFFVYADHTFVVFHYVMFILLCCTTKPVQEHCDPK